MTIKEQVSKRLSETLSAKVVPWRKPLNGEGFPTHVCTKQPFSGVNALLLQQAATAQGFCSKWWGTFEQWQSLDAWVPTQATGTEIVLYKPKNSGTISEAGQVLSCVAKACDKARLSRSLAYNLDQVQGADHLRPVINEGVKPNWQDAERLIEKCGAKINFVFGLLAAYHRPPEDCITFPLKMQFEAGPGKLPGYYDSLGHELMHWTEPRLMWVPDKRQWDVTTIYAINEMRAEMGAGWLAMSLGIPNSSMDLNHLKYLDRWLWAMKKDPGLIFKVAMGACQGVDYLLNFIDKKHERHNFVSVEAA